MLLLTTTSSIIRVVTDAASDIEVYAAVMENNAGAITPVEVPNASITSATTTTVVPAPAASVQRNVKHLSLTNNHATVACNVAVEHYNGSISVELRGVNLLAGENLTLDENGNWRHYDENGGEYPAVLPIATQADMEAATSLLTYVTPGRVHFHPGVAKFVAMTTGTATPALQTPPTYNVTSITDNGVGDLTVTIATDFSSANWCCQCNNEPISVTFTAVANVMRANIRFGGLAAGTVRLTSLDWSPTTNVIRDPITWHVVGYGDFA